MNKLAVIVPNWDGLDSLKSCLDSLLQQTQTCHIIVVENGSTDGSLQFLQQQYPSVELVINSTNLGFAGGVNSGIRRALAIGYSAIALCNNDAVVEKNWLAELSKALDSDPQIAIVTSKITSADKSRLDSTGDFYTTWGLPFPRGRGEAVSDKYDSETEVFSGSGGASLYRAALFQEIGLFDETFFAYYEDVDISFRAQLAGWKVRYAPKAIVYHQIGATSRRIPGFTTYQTLKNLPLLWYKNVPKKYLWHVGWRLSLASSLFFGRAILRGQVWPAVKGVVRGWQILLSKSSERKMIQSSRKVSDQFIWGQIVHNLPPNARALRKLRSMCGKIIGRKYEQDSY